eukprot:COSAG01_NODE_6319_length_3737_cov_4.264156_2_plen_171_part_00
MTRRHQQSPTRRRRALARDYITSQHARADSSRWLGAASPSWEPPPTAPQPVARHPGGGSPALFLPSPPRRWARGWSPERGARPQPPSDYSGCGGAIIAPQGLLGRPGGRGVGWLAASANWLAALSPPAVATGHARPDQRPKRTSEADRSSIVFSAGVSSSQQQLRGAGRG